MNIFLKNRMFLLQILTEELLLLFELVYMIFEVFCFPPPYNFKRVNGKGNLFQ